MQSGKSVASGGLHVDRCRRPPVVEVLDGLATNGEEGNAAVEAKVKAEAMALCARFPIYG